MAFIAGYRGRLIHSCYTPTGSISSAVVNDITAPDETGCIIDLSQLKITRTAIALLQIAEMSTVVSNKKTDVNPDYGLIDYNGQQCFYIAGTGSGTCCPRLVRLCGSFDLSRLSGALVEDHTVGIPTPVMDAIDKLIASNDNSRQYVRMF